MMNDDNDKIDEIIRSAAQDYNRPPNNVPRDEMWAAIQAVQAERARRPLHIVPAERRTMVTRWTWIGIAAAAVLLIATGVGIGRWSSSSSAPAVVRPAQKMASETQKPPTSGGGQGGEAVKVPTEEPTQVASETQKPGSSGGAERGGLGAERAVQGAVRGAPGAERGVQVAERGVPGAERGVPTAGRGVLSAGPNSALTYQVATVRHLSNAEALLTAFKNDNKDAALDASLSIWARDLLSNTRLLLDSPAAEDPQRRKLLGDLELVLAEIVQLAPGATAQDRDLVAGSIRNGNVMTRLRSAIPSGQTRGL